MAQVLSEACYHNTNGERLWSTIVILEPLALSCINKWELNIKFNIIIYLAPYICHQKYTQKNICPHQHTIICSNTRVKGLKVINLDWKFQNAKHKLTHRLCTSTLHRLVKKKGYSVCKTDICGDAKLSVCVKQCWCQINLFTIKTYFKLVGE